MSILFPKAHAHSLPVRTSAPRYDCEAFTRVESILVVQHHGCYGQDSRPTIYHERPYQTLRCAENGGRQREEPRSTPWSASFHKLVWISPDLYSVLLLRSVETLLIKLGTRFHFHRKDRSYVSVMASLATSLVFDMELNKANPEPAATPCGKPPHKAKIVAERRAVLACFLVTSQ